jgi:adenine-specific DNA methylase
LIEVDLPIREISAHARREKSIRHGHISTLHIWWARRPLAACRAVLCASLWPDPADDACPQGFRDAAAVAICSFADQVQHDEKLAVLCKNHWSRWIRTNPTTLRSNDPACWADMRYALLDFIADFANWDASTLPVFLDTARLLTQAAHLALSEMWPVEQKDIPKTSLSEAVSYLESQVKDYPKPLVVDPFAGGGAIPLEALRVGADAFASDLNPVAVLLNKVVLEYIPKYGNARIETKDAEGNPIIFNGLAEAVQYWGVWIKQQAENELSEFYPSNIQPITAYAPQIEPTRKINGQYWDLVSVVQETPIAYIWARTVVCEGPGCGVEIPLLRSLWLAKKRKFSIALEIKPSQHIKHIDFELLINENGKWFRQSDLNYEVKKPIFNGTIRKGSATCPLCGFTTPVEHVRNQLKPRHGGSCDSRLIAVVVSAKCKRIEQISANEEIFSETGRFYRLATDRDVFAASSATNEMDAKNNEHAEALSLVPDEALDVRGIRHTWAMVYGFNTWGDLFSGRQSLTLSTISKLIRELGKENLTNGSKLAIQTCLALALDRQTDYLSTLTVWSATGEFIAHTFGRQAIPMVWDWAECQPFTEVSGNWIGAINWISSVINSTAKSSLNYAQVEQANATSHPLSSDSAQAFITDPPYYDSVPYAYLSDYFYVWLRRNIGHLYPDLFSSPSVPKDEEIVVDRPHELSNSTHTISFYEAELTKAFEEGRRILSPSGIGTVVFASKTTSSWEAILKAVIDSGLIITGSWPIDTEREARVSAIDQARLGSSIHLICRPRESDSGIPIDTIGDWRDILAELPDRIHSWLPRLAKEGIVGADAIFACLGPALEIFSRYSRVEKASGEVVTLKEYLEVVWAAVSREAMSVIFEGADATGFEEDARLTAMWLWTLSGNKPENQPDETENVDTEETDEETPSKANGSGSHYALEYDTARKIAQGLGAHLDRLNSMVEVKGDKARLLSVSERAGGLFGREENPLQDARKKTASLKPSLFSLMVTADGSSAEDEWQEDRIPAGQTTLDQIHQAMLLFGAGRSAVLKRFLVDDGIGKAERFWRLAQALSALYPSNSKEKRWVDGVLAKKKGLGF